MLFRSHYVRKWGHFTSRRFANPISSDILRGMPDYAGVRFDSDELMSRCVSISIRIGWNEVEETGKLYQYDILLSNTYGEKEDELDTIDLFYRKRVDGLVVVSEDMDQEVVAKIKDFRIPYIHIDRYFDPRKIDTVSVEYEKGGYDMTKYLLNLGHHQVADRKSVV